MPTNFDLAPPAKVVDGLTAVPIDIQSLVASLTFDATTHRGAADATITFIVGPGGGCPIFDLRQTISAAWLDGVAIPVTDLAHHDFGGGTDARLRVIASVLAAGSTHTLRLTYTLGLPDALSSSSGPPTYSFSGERLTLKFWYTDLRAGRYLEAWLPSNLQFDQFSAEIEIAILHSSVAHTFVTNAAVTTLGANHVRLSFPAHYTTLSGHVQVQASDELVARTGHAVLPGGATITIQSYKPVGSTVDLAAREAQLAGWLSSNVSAIGPYAHGDRFLVVYDGSGGMEYCGACRAEPGAVKHEAFHSWWGRAVQPAAQSDGWWDEAWTTHEVAAAAPMPFDFGAPPSELCPRNPYTRVTAGASYTTGEDFFQGAAAAMGSATLRALMRSFYEAHRERPVTTLTLEEHLLAGSGRPELVDAFHRFVYGFADPPSGTGLWMRDEPGHTGSEAWSGRFWDSPDLWVRHEDDGGTVHQDPRTGHDNWLYARARNLGPSAARHFVVVFNVRSFAGTEFVYPDDFLPGIAAAGGFELATGGSAVVRARWPAALVPPAGTHACLVAAIFGRLDHPAAGKHVFEQNNLAQKNLTIVAAPPGGDIVLPLRVGSRLSGQRLVLELRRPASLPTLSATLLVPTRRAAPITAEREPLDCCVGPIAGGLSVLRGSSARLFAEATERVLPPGPAAPLRFDSAGGFPATLGLRLRLPPEVRPGQSLIVDLVQRDPVGRVVGGVAVRLDVTS